MVFKTTTGRPNYFYYVSEPKVIQVPEYAGLIHIINLKL